jgi:hypothetical protein
MSSAKKVWKAPSYCTQNNGDCWSCSLNNYGRDCLNYPIPPAIIKELKVRRAVEYAREWKKQINTDQVLRIINEDPQIIDYLTARELGLAMILIGRAYTKGYIIGYEEGRRQEQQRQEETK